MYLWRAVDQEGEVLDVLVQAKRDKRAALKLMRKLLKKQGFAPSTMRKGKRREEEEERRERGRKEKKKRDKGKRTRAVTSHEPVRRLA